jgi:divinyl protochlorophyllide a 8-vinyl-reductase
MTAAAVITATAPDGADSARIGPNAVIQLAQALRAGPGEDVARQIFERAGALESLSMLPTEMVPEALPQRLFSVLYATLPLPVAYKIATDAGERTADYLLAHRIPAMARWLLGILPMRLAVPLLLAAIARNAWTFAGSGRCHVSSRPRPVIEIEGNPFTMPGCAWHIAVFTRLVRILITPQVRVRQTSCCYEGGSACRFELVLGES